MCDQLYTYHGCGVFVLRVNYKHGSCLVNPLSDLFWNSQDNRSLCGSICLARLVTREQIGNVLNRQPTDPGLESLEFGGNVISDNHSKPLTRLQRALVARDVLHHH